MSSKVVRVDGDYGADLCRFVKSRSPLLYAAFHSHGVLDPCMDDGSILFSLEAEGVVPENLRGFARDLPKRQTGLEVELVDSPLHPLISGVRGGVLVVAPPSNIIEDVLMSGDFYRSQNHLPMMALLPMSVLSGKVRQRMFRIIGLPSAMIALVRRPKSVSQDYAWFVWGTDPAILPAISRLEVEDDPEIEKVPETKPSSSIDVPR